MKRNQRFAPDDPREWLRRAKSSLAHARAADPDVDLAENCFDAQQCAEKAIKAVFVHRSESFPFTHDLRRLLQRLERVGVKIPKYLRAVEELSRFAFAARYPGPESRVERRAYLRALRLAAATLRWAQRMIALRRDDKSK